ncbi:MULTISPECIES: LrgB family protein [Pseudomonas]
MARELEHHPHAGAFAALGMGLNGIATALLVPVVVSVLPLAGLR